MKYGVKRKYYKVDTRVCPYGSEFYTEYDNIGLYSSEQFAFTGVVKDIQDKILSMIKDINTLPWEEDINTIFTDLYTFNFGKLNCIIENGNKIIEYIDDKDEMEVNVYYLIKPLTDTEVDSFLEFYEF